jgi:hypothetical protein
MPFNINEMKSQLTFGGARPTLFSVKIFNPANSSADVKTEFMVQTSQIPSSTISPIEVAYFGRRIKLAGDRSYDTWSVTVINDEDFLVRNAMEEWSNRINGSLTNLRTFGGAQPSLYKSQALVTQYGRTGDTLRQYKFNGIFPLDISTIELDWGSTDTIETFSVTFAYDNWEVSSAGRTGNGGGI